MHMLHKKCNLLLLRALAAQKLTNTRGNTKKRLSKDLVDMAEIVNDPQACMGTDHYTMNYQYIAVNSWRSSTHNYEDNKGKHR